MSKLTRVFTFGLDFYVVGVVVTGVTVAAGNLYNSCRIFQRNEDFKMLERNMIVSLCKSTYGLVWPYLLFKTYYKTQYLKPNYKYFDNKTYTELFGNNDGKIDNNGYMKHFIPEYKIHRKK